MRVRVIWDHFRWMEFASVAAAERFADWVNQVPPAKPWNGVADVFVWDRDKGFFVAVNGAGAVA